MNLFIKGSSLKANNKTKLLWSYRNVFNSVPFKKESNSVKLVS
jgi:hypothetical protein